MARTSSLLPGRSGITRRGLNAMIRDMMEYYPKAYEEAYIQEVEIIIKGLIDTTPIDTGAAAGVTSNSVGSQKRAMYAGHAAGTAEIGNQPGNTGWQLEVMQTPKILTVSIVNPQWDSYLKYLELGLVNPIPPGKSHFVFDQVQLHIARREKIADKVRRGRPN